MKTILRFQSQLLNRRSYKPGRRVRVAFRPTPRLVLPMTVATPVPPLLELHPINDS
jgi:hypothetical protein